ncbi:kinase-like protein [Dichomitus squalens LYAD-421 SS1]|uniref:Kinase-like protein n=1 Tax=Dichomitus squalens (strain LYAD-421) TaxID=732165 RepID=R7SUJ8_DICSQ|nr:kinase-like protein [Dichomitus squalens LYAD-421 SS1]EJF59711.1 kinase-like protein [Dichomitus squalens LYAD-421 SS1]
MAERGYRNLNASVLRQISKVLEHDSTADIEPVLKRVYNSYSALRRAIGERQEKRRTVPDEDQEERCIPAKRRASYPAALSGFVSPIQAQRAPLELHLTNQKPLSCPLLHSVVFPLSHVVRDLLKLTADHESNLSAAALRCVLSGAPIWEGRSRAVIQVGENVVVKVAQHLDYDEHGVLEFLEQHVPNIAAPRPLGLIAIGPTSFMFMTKIPGATLETRWPSLPADAKAHIRCLLDQQLSDLRTLDLPPGSPLGSPVGRRLCKDVRRDERVSITPIYSEPQFNDFLLDSPTSRASSSYKEWLHSMLRADHRVVFTHADIHPRNIMVVDGPRGVVELSGILDWEASGFYPEYWEQLKALNTRSVKDDSDWWNHLPPCILGYDHEVVVDRVIEATAIY